MLRDYLYIEDWHLIETALEQFIDLPSRLSLVGFTSLSPDSFVWKIFDGKHIYYLYAEDYVQNLEHVKKQILSFWPEKINLEFIPVKTPIPFEDSSPNKSAAIYKPPADEYEFAKYAARSGYDFVFLLKSNETR